MPDRKPWDKFEISLLIDACEKYLNGENKRVLIRKLSSNLRQRAIDNGVHINDLFRNENGITLQMLKIEYLITQGKTGLPGASKSFSEMIAMKHTDPNQFDAILKHAMLQINKENYGGNSMTPKRNEFISWINTQGKLKVHPNTIISVLDTCSEYAQKHGISKISFWDVAGSEQFVDIYRKLTSNKLFRVFKRDSAQILDKTYGYYRDFLSSYIADNIADKPTVITGKENEKKANPTEQNNNPSLVIDFTQDISLAFTKPTKFIYFDCEHFDIRSWTDLYVRLFSLLYEDYPDLFYSGTSFSIKEDSRIDLGDEIASIRMRAPKKVPTAEDLFLETNLSATNIVDKLKFIIAACNVDFENIKIFYTVLQRNNDPTNDLYKASSPIQPTTKRSVAIESEFIKWMQQKGVQEATIKNYASCIRTAQDYAVKLNVEGVNFTTTDHDVLLTSIDAMLACKEFIQINKQQHNRFSAAFRKLRDYLTELERLDSQLTSDTALEIKHPSLYRKLYCVAKTYDDPQGLTLERILRLIANIASPQVVRNFLDEISWATKLSDDVYSFAKTSHKASVENIKIETLINTVPTDFDKAAFIRVLMTRYQSGMQFDSIDLENFRDTYENMYDEKLAFSDEELEVRLKYCGILYKDRLFPAEGIIDNSTKERLFTYIENKFAAGSKVLYYKAIFSDLSDAFVYCFSLTDEQMLRAYIEYASEKDKYYFHGSFMSVEKDVKVDHSTEIEDFMLSTGKPLTYEEVYEGLSHISKDIVHRTIRHGSQFIMNGKEQYFHIDIFEFSEEDRNSIIEILDNEISEKGYAIWSAIFDTVKEQMALFLENNLYLAPLGIRNSIAKHISDRYSFNGDVISYINDDFDMADVYRLFAKNNTPFTDVDIYEFSKKTDPFIYFNAVAEEAVRVSKELFVAKDCVEFDVAETDKAIATYFSSGYILIKDVDSFLVFPNVGYEWNEFLLESYLLNYSEKFTIVNNGTSLNNVAGAIVYKNSEYTFVDVCAEELANSTIELKKANALNYMAEINLITRRSYKDIETAMTKARQIRNLKG